MFPPVWESGTVQWCVKGKVSCVQRSECLPCVVVRTGQLEVIWPLSPRTLHCALYLSLPWWRWEVGHTLHEARDDTGTPSYVDKKLESLSFYTSSILVPMITVYKIHFFLFIAAAAVITSGGRKSVQLYQYKRHFRHQGCGVERHSLQCLGCHILLGFIITPLIFLGFVVGSLVTHTHTRARY